MREDTKPTPPDGGYGWVVVAASFFTHAMVMGDFYSFGVFFGEYIDEFNSSRAATALVGALAGALSGISGVLTGPFIDVHGNNAAILLGGCLIGSGLLLGSMATSIWHLYFTQGLLGGIGASFSILGAMSIVGQWFTNKRGVAVGIALAGSGLGQFAIVIVTQHLVGRFGWRGALRVLGITTITVLTICSFGARRFDPPPAAPRSLPRPQLSLFRKPNFGRIYIAILCHALGVHVPATYIVVYSQRYGISKSDAIYILAAMGISSAFGRVLVGYLGDSLGKLRMMKVCEFGAAVSTLCWMACKDFPTILTYAIIFGFFNGGEVALVPTVSAELFGAENLGSVLGLFVTGSALGSLLSSPVGGLLIDFTGSYFASIAFAGSSMLIALSVVLRIDGRVFTSVAADPQPIERKLDADHGQVQEYKPICAATTSERGSSNKGADGAATPAVGLSSRDEVEEGIESTRVEFISLPKPKPKPRLSEDLSLDLAEVV